MESSSWLHDVDYNSLSSVEPNTYHTSFQSHQQRKQQQHRIVSRRPDPDSDPIPVPIDLSIRVSLSKQSINTSQSSPPKHRSSSSRSTTACYQQHSSYTYRSVFLSEALVPYQQKELPSSRSDSFPFFFSPTTVEGKRIDHTYQSSQPKYRSSLYVQSFPAKYSYRISYHRSKLTNRPNSISPKAQAR